MRRRQLVTFHTRLGVGDLAGIVVDVTGGQVHGTTTTSTSGTTWQADTLPLIVMSMKNRGGGGGWGGGGGGGGGGFGGGGGASSRSGASGGTSFPFDETEDEKNPEEGERWVKQAEAEFAVLSCLHSQAAACSGYFYVCFMAHQVVERALKGAVCALCGMDGRNLDDVSDSNLGRNARALEAVQPERTEGLVHHVIPLEDYYLNTRYPNKWEGYTDIPAEHYAQDDADQAKEHAQAVLAIVRAIMPAINED